MFVFSLDRPGITKGKPCECVGARELNQGEIFFDNVRVPKKYLVIGPDRYEEVLKGHISMTTVLVGLWGVGLARAAFEEDWDKTCAVKRWEQVLKAVVTSGGQARGSEMASCSSSDVL